MIFSSVLSGLYRSWSIKRIILIFLLLNLVTASLSINPYMNAFQKFFSHRLVTDVLAHSNVYTFYVEFYHYMAPAVEAAKGSISLGALFYLVFSMLLSGGVVYFIIATEPVNLRKFWLESSRFFGRMSRMLFIAAVCILAALFIGIIIPLPFTYFLPSPFVENVYAYFYAGWFLFVWLMLVFAFIIIDLSKVLIVQNDDNSVIKMALHSLKFIFHNPGNVVFSYLFLYIYGIVLFVLYWWLQQFIPDDSAWGVFIGLSFLQVYIFLQYWIKFSRYGAIYQVLESQYLEVT